MDSSDPGIEFDARGVCSHCNEFEASTKGIWFPNEEGAVRLKRLVSRLASEGSGHDFDCILGLSGGVDSSYLALKAHEWGLRPLVVHVDAGWNSEVAVQNIEKLVDYCGYELHTEVVDWDTMRRLQVAYLRSGVSNQDVPQDHAFFASIYNFAKRNHIRSILSGFNVATESVAPQWHASAMDATNIRAIFSEFGEGSLDRFPLVSFSQYYLVMPLIRRMRTLAPLNLIPYNREFAIRELTERVGWRSYGRKHGESLFTRFFQNYYLPTRFSFDKRRPHYSGLILSGQLTRTRAIELIEEPLYDPGDLARDSEYVRKKLRLNAIEWQELMNAPKRSQLEFANWNTRRNMLKAIQSGLTQATGRLVRIHG